MYKCHVPDCGRAFIQLSNLQQHLRSHVSQSERLKNRPFHCAICDRGFATESSMRTHNSKVCSTVNKNKKGRWSSLSNWDLWFRQCCCKFDNWIKALPQSGTRHFVQTVKLGQSDCSLFKKLSGWIWQIFDSSNLSQYIF